MRILLIHNYYQYRGGEETYFESLVKLLRKKGHIVITYTKDNRDIKTLWDKIMVGIGMFWNFRVEKELSELIKKYKPQIAHFNNIFPLIGLNAYRICKKYNIPVVQTINNYRFICPNPILFRNGKINESCIKRKNYSLSHIFYGCYHQSKVATFFFVIPFLLHQYFKTINSIDMFIFPSEFTKDYYLKHSKILKQKTAFIPYFVNLKKDKIKKKKKRDYFLYVGRLAQEKGVIPLLEVFKKLSNMKLVVLGTGPLSDNVEKYKKYKNIEIKGDRSKNRVRFYMSNAICVIIPSLWYEVLPFVYIESLANNTPVLIPDSDNFNKIDDKNIMFKYHQGNFQDLKEKIINIANRRLNTSDVYYKEYKKRYTPDLHYELIMEQYCRFL